MTQQAVPPRQALVFAPGARVVVRDEEWIVRATKPATPQHSAVHVTGLSELVRGREAIFRTELDEVRVLRPEETQLVVDSSPEYRRSRLYLESLLRRTPATDATIHIGHTGAMKPMPYQLAPAVKALGQLRPRLLIADGVGIGKTVEVGILLSELIQRGQGERILVLALKSILTQLQQELWARFTIPLVRLDSAGLERVRAKIPSNQNPFGYFDKVILSIDTLKNDEKYRRHLEQSRWDVIVIDECQNVITKEHGRSQRARLAELLAPTTNALILTSATPHDGTAKSFASLMNLLEPTAVADPENYTKEDVAGLFVRRFKKDVAASAQGNFRDRDAQLRRVTATHAEDAAFNAIAALEFRTLDKHRSGKGDLFRTTLLKAFLSSPAACLSTIDEREKRLAKSDKDAADVRFDREQLATLRTAVEAVTPDRVAKLTELCSYLEKAGIGPKSAERVVIFSERIQTLEFLERELQRRFKLRETQITKFHGTLGDLDQQEIVRSFGSQASDVRVLLASDAASEGLNLHQQCHRLVHFDLPWSLIRLAQRDGRIDRFGQTRTPEIRYLLTVPGNKQLKGDLRVLERLVDRERVADKQLGDVAFLMNLHDPEREEERIAVAIETHEPAENVIPDAPVEEDFLNALLGDDSAEAAATATPVSLYADDLAYARAAFDELRSKNKDMEAPEWHPDGRGFTFVPPTDLRHRFAFLPREVSDQEELILTTDRARVDAALTRARSTGTWPKDALLWAQHPVMGWINDRVLAAFERHEAPVLRVARGLEKAHACYIVQGVLSNRLSQPIVVDWFGVLVDAQGTSTLTFEKVVALTGLGQKLVNDRGEVDARALTERLPQVVQAATKHMAARRKARETELMPRLQSELRRLKTWASCRREQMEAAKQARTAGGRKLRSDEEKLFEAEERSIQRRETEREEWLTNRLKTEPIPYIRIAAVLVPREVRS